MDIQTTEYTVDRFSVPLPGTFDDVVSAFEDLVPLFDGDSSTAAFLRQQGGDALEEWIYQNAPHGLLRYWRQEPTDLMAATAHTTRWVSYLVGNQLLAERVSRFDPRAVGLSPVTVTISQRTGDPVLLTADVPSAALWSFSDGRISAVATSIDVRLAGLLLSLGATLPEPLALTRSACPTAG